MNNQIPFKILLVEDSDYKIEKVKLLISDISNEIEVMIAGNIIDAQRLLLEKKFDVMIFDMQLPQSVDDNSLEQTAGMIILEDLSMDDNYHKPTTIISLTQFDELEETLRESHPEIAVLKFDATSDKWRNGLKRTICYNLQLKSKASKIVYCEGSDASLYNLLGYSNIEFRGVENSRAVYMNVKNEAYNYGIRDRDFITSKEKHKLCNCYKNYVILDLYSIENYLFHPDNLCEYLPSFNRELYIGDITAQKKAKLLTIIQDYKLSRNTYLDLNDDQKDKLDRNPEEEIAQALNSDNFDIFYPFFDMAGKTDSDNKKSYHKSFLAEYNFDKKELMKTAWMKRNFDKILSSIL